MKLNRFWHICDDDYVMNQLKRDGIEAPELVAGVPFSDLIDLARKGDGLIEWVSNGGYMVYVMGSSDVNSNLLGSSRGWDSAANQDAIYVNIRLAAIDKYVDMMSTMDAHESVNTSDGFSYRVYKIPLSNHRKSA